MQIMYINNDGAGFADQIHVEDGTTVSKLFTQRVPHGRASDYLIRVNRQPATSDQVLQPGDRVSFTPVKIEGARATWPHAFDLLTSGFWLLTPFS